MSSPSSHKQALKVKNLHNPFEQEKELSKKIEELQGSDEALVKEKQSLEELNSTWSRKIVEQKDEIDLMKTKMTKMETSMEEMSQQLDMKNKEVETFKEKENTEVGIIPTISLGNQTV